MDELACQMVTSFYQRSGETHTCMLERVCMRALNHAHTHVRTDKHLHLWQRYYRFQRYLPTI